MGYRSNITNLKRNRCMKVTEKIAKETKDIMSSPTQLVLATTNRPRSIEHSDEMSLFYQVHPDAGSLRLQFVGTSKGVHLNAIVDYLIANEWECVRSHESYNIDNGRAYTAWQSWIHPHYPAMIMFEGDSRNKKENSRSILERLIPVEEFRTKEIAPDDILVAESIRMVSSIDNRSCSKIWADFLDICRQNKVPGSTSPRLGMISHDGSDFYVKNFSLEGKTPAFAFPDLHYGEGFEKFHGALLKRLTEESKGLVLLHGEPGTGKTQYIRVLLNELGIIGKSVLYVPPSFSSQLTEPGMIEFISDWIIEEEKDCILLIEDAEPLLEIRNGADGRTTGISNLLNMTDGLLNDILGLMVIATFNTSITKIDPALLRPQRLIARKEFGKLDHTRGEDLAIALNIANPLDVDKYPATLAEFYSSKKEATVLIHEVKDDKPKIGFK
jgi:ATPase family associated with various cellular activities (AAA)